MRRRTVLIIMSEKVVVITGASSGIGAALAKELGSKGAILVLAARREKQLKQVADQVGSKSLPVVTDVTRRNDVDRLRDLALKEFDHINVWVNNAGRGVNRSFLELTDHEFDEMLDVNLKSVFYGTRAIIPYFQQRGEGHLINVSSFLGRVPLVSYRSAYSAAKSAVNTLTANVRMDLLSQYPRIHVSLVMPGTVDTEFHTVSGKPLNVRAGNKLGPMVVQSAQEVADKIVSLIDHPVAELYTNPSLPELTRRYYQDVASFEENFSQR
jgi:NADP-dependent 3-hydroxy acid dehydrogenase YdfG